MPKLNPALSTVLIANRSEIAVRIVRAATDLGMTSVAVYSTEDRDALHVRMATHAFALGNQGAAAYLDAPALIAIAQRAGADAVHPGYGFLAENASFARAVQAAGLTWIGPAPESLEELGDKVRARELAAAAGARAVPGTPAPVSSAQEVADFGAQHGFPVLIKACFGGGGRGMRVVNNAADAVPAFESAAREALAGFGRAECFVEKYFDRARHVETQCLADAHGNIAVVSTRDCSVQRRHQKLIEEAPAPFLTPQQETELAAVSRALLREANYVGAATCEFLLADTGELFFMEINPRLQVEHPVTEEITGVDLVREQFRIAAGEPLTFTSTPAHGHAIEFRINAEDPAAGFAPRTGALTDLHLPSGPGVRCDFGYRPGDTLTGAFDSLIGKVIVRGATRQEALARGRRALRELQVGPLATSKDFHRAVLEDPAFTAPDRLRAHTTWVETEFRAPLPQSPATQPGPAGDPVSDAAGTPSTSRVVVEVDGKRLEVVLPAELTALEPSAPQATTPQPLRTPPRRARKDQSSATGASTDGKVTAPMQGTVARVLVTEGQHVEQGEPVVVLEAMKMEQPLPAPRAGVVRNINAQVGAQVSAGHPLCEIDPAPAPAP